MNNMSSYVLDRELLLNSLGSGRVVTTTTAQSNWIDVNSNSALLGSNIYQRNTEAECKKQMADLQDQINMLRLDIEKKDRLICELSSAKEIEKIRGVESAKYDAIFSVERSAAENAKRELAATVVKYETVSTELCEFKAKVQARDDRINELKREIESLKSENATMNSLIVALRTKLKELEGNLGGFETVASKSEITITTLQRENRTYQQQLLELESRIRTHMNEREESERKFAAISNKLTELAIKITSITGASITSDVAGLELIIAKINDIVTENSTLKGQLLTKTDTLTSKETENKANTETIQRLVTELNKFEKDAATIKIQMDALKAERDTALTTKSMLEKELEVHKERIISIQTAWQASRVELEAKDTELAGHNANLKQFENDALFYKNCLNSLKEQVATLLSDGFVKVDANEDQIKEKVKLLMTSSKDRGLMIASMEGKIQQLATQLTEQVNLYKELEAKYHRGESHIIELESKLKSLDHEYCATEVIRDNLKSDRVKYLTFLERVGNILKLNQISVDIGLDMNVDLILARIEQLVRMENDSLQDKQTNIYNLQRKVKALKEQLDNKELHLDLLRKKLSALEEERSSKHALEKEIDDHVLMGKKFKTKVEKLTEQLNSLKCENTSLKAQLTDVSCFKGKTCEQEKEISKLLMKISELESIKEKQSSKIAKLRDELDSISSETNKTRHSSETVVQSLSQELRHAKLDLEKTLDREKQLLDFRCVVARMLGLESHNLAVADYEIVSRLERIITSFNGGVLPVHIQPLPYNSTNLSSTDGYTSSSTSNFRSSSASKRVQHSHSQSNLNGRERSPSPHHHSHHHHHHRYETTTSSSSPAPRHRSKSPRKVTIDPNSY